MLRPRRREMVFLVALLLCVPAVVPTSAGATTVSEPVAPQVNGSATAGPAENDTTVRHRDPASVSVESDLSAVRRQLAQQAASRVRSGAVELEQEDYDPARELMGDQYDDLVQQYADTGGESGGVVLQELRASRRAQAEYITAVESYQETLDRYRLVRTEENLGYYRYAWTQSGKPLALMNESERADRARVLARQLNDLSQQVNRSGADLIRHQRNVSELTDAEFTSASAIRNTTARTTSTQAEIRNREFERTRLTLDTAVETATFRDPATINGRLVTANGSAVPNRTVTLNVSGRHFTVTTDADGWIAFDYRPVTIPTNATGATFRYVPVNTSRYLGSTARVSLRIEQVEPTVAVNVRPTQVGFNDTLVADGRVMVDEVGVHGVPVELAAGGRELGVANTTADGTFTLATPFPAGVDVGESRVRATLPLQNRALADRNGSTMVSVTETQTVLSTQVTRIGPRVVRLHGTLATRDGSPVANRSVDVTVNGTTVTTGFVNATGRFDTAVAVSPSIAAPEGGTATLALRFDGQGTNLGQATTSSSVTLTAPASGDSWDFTIPTWAWAGLGGLLLLLLGWLYRTRSGRRSQRAFSSPDGGGSAGPGIDTVDAARAEKLLSAARAYLDAGEPDRAVLASYGAVRRGLSTGGGTHWEFYQQSTERGLDGSRAAALRQLTEGFERAAFAASSVSVETAERAIELANEVTAGTGEAAPTAD